MPLWLQHAVVLLLVAGALAYLGASAWRTLAARKGNCCGGKTCARADDMKRRLEAARKRAGGTPSRT